jgi:hypothetical protein
LANGKPFAVIFPIDKYKRDIAETPNKISGNILIIKGLDGYEKINHQIVMKRYLDPYKEARKLADQFYIEYVLLPDHR